MRSFRSHLKEKFKDERFTHLYEEEKQLAELSVRILRAREQVGLSQHEAAKRAKVTQQQLSKIENGINCNMFTFLKVCNALDLRVELESSRDEQVVGYSRQENEDSLRTPPGPLLGRIDIHTDVPAVP